MYVRLPYIQRPEGQVAVSHCMCGIFYQVGMGYDGLDVDFVYVQSDVMHFNFNIFPFLPIFSSFLVKYLMCGKLSLSIPSILLVLYVPTTYWVAKDLCFIALTHYIGTY